MGKPVLWDFICRELASGSVFQCKLTCYAQIAQCKCKLLITIVNISTVLLGFSKLAPIPHQVDQVCDWL